MCVWEMCSNLQFQNCIHNWDSTAIHQKDSYSMQVNLHATEQSVKESSDSFWDCLFVLLPTRAWSGHLSGSTPALGAIHSAANCPEKGVCIDPYIAGAVQWFTGLGEKANPKIWSTLHFIQCVLFNMPIGIQLICRQTFVFGGYWQTKWLHFQIQCWDASVWNVPSCFLFCVVQWHQHCVLFLNTIHPPSIHLSTSFWNPIHHSINAIVALAAWSGCANCAKGGHGLMSVCQRPAM